MKKIIVLFLFISTLSYSQFSIKGTMTSTQNSSWVLLYKIEGTTQSFIKNTQIRKEDKKGFFEFSLPNGAQKGTYRIKLVWGKMDLLIFYLIMRMSFLNLTLMTQQTHLFLKSLKKINYIHHLLKKYIALNSL